jgi:putative membrane protein
MDITFASVLSALGTGLPVLLGHLVAVLVLLGIGVVVYIKLTPYDEMALVRAGNAAGGLTFAGAIVALAIPLAATLATSGVLADILIWGIVAVILQLLAFLFASRLIPGLAGRIESGNLASATLLVGVQLGVALINAAAMAG